MNLRTDYTVSGGGGVGAALNQSPVQPFTDAVGSRISTLIDLIGDTRGALAEVADRLLGAVPRGVSPENAAKPNGVGGEILARLDSLIETAADARNEAQRLQSGI